jgi:1-hydroxycarotenoid 3,4-desaturase
VSAAPGANQGALTPARRAPRVVVIGSGIGGLSAAISLAAVGADVTVVEAAERPGGKAGEELHDGVRFDTGPSVLTMPEVFEHLFARAGLALSTELDLLRPDPATRYHFPTGATLDVPADPAALVERIRATLGASTAEEAAAFLSYARTIWDAAAPHFVFGPAPEPARLLRLIPTAIRLLPRIDPLRTMSTALDARVKRTELRWLFERFATYNGSDPRRAPATLHCIAHVELGLGVWGVRGGMFSLVRALVRALERSGGTLRTHAPVAQIDVHHRQVRGVTLADGQSLPCDAVVANADAAYVRAALVPADQTNRLRRPGPPSMSGWTAVLRARRRPAVDRPAHAILFPAAYANEFGDIFDRDRPPADPTVYLCAQEKAHARAGWEDHEPLFVMANAPPEPPDRSSDPAQWPALRGRVLDRLRGAGLIDADDAVVWERSPTHLAALYPGTRGAIYGSASNDPWAAFRRPPNRTAIAGLYLASGSAHPGGGVPMCALSGLAAADAAIADLRLPPHPAPPLRAP